MKHTETILDTIGEKIAALEEFQRAALQTLGRFQQVHDFVKGEPEEEANKDPITAILAVMARWKEEAHIAVERANDSGRIAQQLQQALSDLQAKFAPG